MIAAEMPEMDGEQQELEIEEPTGPPRRATDGWTPFVLEGGGEGTDEPHEASEASDPFVPEPVLQESQPEPPKEPDMEPARSYDDWLAETSSGGETLDFPERGPAMRLLDQRPEEREKMRERVSNLFPDPETTDWSISEIAVERRRRAE